MKKGKRVLIGSLCMVLLLTNTMSTGIQVLTVGKEPEKIYVYESLDEEDIVFCQISKKNLAWNMYATPPESSPESRLS